jgi:hypothetical protein
MRKTLLIVSITALIVAKISSVFAITDADWFKYKSYVHVNHFTISGKIVTKDTNIPAEAAFITFLDYDQRDVNTLHTDKKGNFKGYVYNNTAFMKLCSADGQCQVITTHYIYKDGPLDNGKPIKNLLLKVPPRKFM